ncbi:ribonuclease III [Candidatus Saccharibacteria bacterium]|nr:ribonuclease III [Candidatus Saccharibacteria bacterium]
MNNISFMTKAEVAEYQRFAENRLGFKFHDINLLVTALTHRSYVNEHLDTCIEHNERLEFLGDAILELVSSDFLFRNFDESEGVMTCWRSALVRTEAIGDAGRRLGYPPLIRMSRGELIGSSRAHDSIIADCFEAVIGAIYIDQGFKTAREFIYNHILTSLASVIRNESWRDPKSYFQELAQQFSGHPPQYRTIREDGPDHDKIFTVAAYVNGQVLARADGHSKQEAQVICAEQASKYYKKKYADVFPPQEMPKMKCPDWLHSAYPI